MTTLVNRDPFTNLHNIAMIYRCFQIFSITQHVIYIIISVELSEAERAPNTQLFESYIIIIYLLLLFVFDL